MSDTYAKGLQDITMAGVLVRGIDEIHHLIHDLSPRQVRVQRATIRQDGLKSLCSLQISDFYPEQPPEGQAHVLCSWPLHCLLLRSLDREANRPIGNLDDYLQKVRDEHSSAYNLAAPSGYIWPNYIETVKIPIYLGNARQLMQDSNLTSEYVYLMERAINRMLERPSDRDVWPSRDVIYGPHPWLSSEMESYLRYRNIHIYLGVAQLSLPDVVERRRIMDVMENIKKMVGNLDERTSRIVDVLHATLWHGNNPDADWTYTKAKDDLDASLDTVHQINKDNGISYDEMWPGWIREDLENVDSEDLHRMDDCHRRACAAQAALFEIEHHGQAH